MLITRAQLVELSSAAFERLVSLVDDDTEDLLYLLLHDLLLESTIEIPDTCACCITDITSVFQTED